MRNIVSPLNGIISPLGPQLGSFLGDYEANGVPPQLVFAPMDGKYAAHGKPYIPNMTGYEANGYARTFYDADGVLKRQAHNLLAYSEDFTNGEWEKTNPTVTADQDTAPNGTFTADLITLVSGATDDIGQVAAVSPGADYVFAFWAKNIDASDLKYRVYNNIAASDVIPVTTYISNLNTETYTKVEVSFTVPSGCTEVKCLPFSNSAAGNNESFYLWGAHLYRSDLPMADNPATGDSYVPTTDSAIVLPRVPSYLYDADTAMWNAHNYLLWSQDISDAVWSDYSSDDIATANYAEAPDGTMTATRLVWDNTGADYRYQYWNGGSIASAELLNIPLTFGFWYKSTDGADYTFSVRSAGQNGMPSETVTATALWQYASFSFTATGTILDVGFDCRTTYGSDVTGDVLIWGAHGYRSDLNGVVPNSGNPVSGLYVKTTDTAVPATLNAASAYKNAGFYLESDAATNLVPYSQDFTHSNWLTGASTIALDATGPDGVTDSAGTLSDDQTGGVGRVSLATSVTASTSTAVTFSILIKADGVSWAAIRVIGSTSSDGIDWFDLSSGAVGTSANNGMMTNIGGGWFRCSISYTTDTVDQSASMVVHACEEDNNLDADLDGTSSILIYGAQFEASPIPTSYIPTAGAAETRPAETAQFDESIVPYPVQTGDGNELVTNGGFDSDTTGWVSNNADLAVVGGELQLSNQTVSPANANQSLQFVVGKQYIATVTSRVTGAGGDVARASLFGTFFAQSSAGAGPTTESLVVTASVASATLSLLSYGTSETEAYFDNISVQEVLPLAMSFSFKGLVNYADEDVTTAATFLALATGTDWIFQNLSTGGGLPATVGTVDFNQRADARTSRITSLAEVEYAPGLNVPISIASRNTSDLINGAVDGTALTENTTPTEFPAIEGQPLQIGPTFNGHVQEIVVWGADQGDIGNAGIAEASGD